jgi:hypothetical protein
MSKHNREMRASEYLAQELRKSILCGIALFALIAVVAVIAVYQISNEPLELSSVYQGETK